MSKSLLAHASELVRLLESSQKETWKRNKRLVLKAKELKDRLENFEQLKILD